MFYHLQIDHQICDDQTSSMQIPTKVGFPTLSTVPELQVTDKRIRTKPDYVVAKKQD